MLHLKYQTPAEWATAALADSNALLLDHMFCESKAAARARGLVHRHGRMFPRIVAPLHDLAGEEDGHAAMCEKLLHERNVERTRYPGNAYIAELRQHAVGKGRGTVLDQLLLASMIEARSCERFRLLADACRDNALGRFYEDLFAAEARHHVLFVDLAVDLFGEEETLTRLDTVAAVEGEICAARPWGPRIH